MDWFFLMSILAVLAAVVYLVRRKRSLDAMDEDWESSLDDDERERSTAWEESLPEFERDEDPDKDD